jgi:hypothetical protein
MILLSHRRLPRFSEINIQNKSDDFSFSVKLSHLLYQTDSLYTYEQRVVEKQILNRLKSILSNIWDHGQLTTVYRGKQQTT